MSQGGVAADGSVTLTLAEAQGMLEGVTLNLNSQVRSLLTQHATLQRSVAQHTEVTLHTHASCEKFEHKCLETTGNHKMTESTFATCCNVEGCWGVGWGVGGTE